MILYKLLRKLFFSVEVSFFWCFLEIRELGKDFTMLKIYDLTSFFYAYERNIEVINLKINIKKQPQG